MQRVIVSQFHADMRGLTKAQLFTTADGDAYVVKSQYNPFGPSVLISELIGGELLRRLGLPVPPFALVEMHRGAPGVVHFGSRYAGEPGRTAVYDFLPDKLLDAVENADVFAGSFVFDIWVANTDLRNIIFARAAPDGLLARALKPYLIDNSHLFGGPSWDFRETAMTGVTFSRAAYGGITDWDALNPWLERIVEIAQPSIIGEAIAGLPDEWVCCEVAGRLDYIAQQLMNRARTLKSRLKSRISANPRMLPNWREDLK